MSEELSQSGVCPFRSLDYRRLSLVFIFVHNAKAPAKELRDRADKADDNTCRR